MSLCIVKCKIVILHQWFYWQWFIALGLGRTTSDSICHLLDRNVLWTVPNRNFLSQLMERCLFIFRWVDFQDLLHHLASDFYSMKFEFNSNQIRLQLKSNSIEFELHAMSFNIFTWMKLNFDKINSYFSLTKLSLVACDSTEPKCTIRVVQARQWVGCQWTGRCFLSWVWIMIPM